MRAKSFAALALGTALGAWPAAAFGATEHRDDRIEQEVPGRPDLVRVTHIFRKRDARTRTPCLCPTAQGTRYTLERVRWQSSAFNYTVYTAGSGAGPAAGQAVRDSFDAWRAAEPAAPLASASQNDASPGPEIAFDGEQAVIWRSLSNVYGTNTLAVTVYWYSRAKVNGFSPIVHFDMAFNTDFPWAVLGAGESCGGGGAYDIRDVGTHEAGHAYGLGHDSDCNLTMNPTAGPGETIKSTLAPGDASGIQALY
ncbi:MAG: matrixin family metalloprotease [Elusimicrobia bacterium]|nr:matrixin family metalloprotease [Elusimicrobiota bacterium]